MKQVLLCLLLALSLTACGQAGSTAEVSGLQPELQAVALENKTDGDSAGHAQTPAAQPNPTPTPTPPITQEQLQQAVDQARADYGATAIQAAVIRDGQVAAQAASGWAVEDQITLTTRHKMRCASLTKVMVGISAGVLIDDGTLDPYADLSGYWGVTARNPSYPDTPITVDMLLTHTSTLSDASGSLSALKGTAARQRLAGSGYTGGKPGELSSWSYNNYGFSVLGMTLERAADQVLDDVLGEAVLTPMGIDAAFEAGSVDDTGLLCALYYPGNSLSRTVSTQKSYVCIQQPGYRGNFFAGGFTCSAGELAQLVAMLAEDGTYQGQQYLSAETVAYLEQPLGQTPDGFYQCRPLRYRENMYGRDRMYYHTGSAYGFYGLLSYDPDTRDGVVVFTTGASGVTDSYGVYAVCGQVAQAVYG
ncbi:serine hydrolase domain-containing protein [uncultured Flavonifractor sp.]|uniref:serine hydrolase domain-containing protein n=1 Tax=uncultured Flavonifractor sp. TaxID=1193534 RepID=UPI002629A85C|nr:serine hydrolase domain-containing protein [uncultured Flavonifractor sp.]